MGRPRLTAAASIAIAGALVAACSSTPATQTTSSRNITPVSSVPATSTSTPTPTPIVPTSFRHLVGSKTVAVPHLASKSVVASGTGLFFAQNMMYEHTISVFDSHGNLVKTIPDAVNLADFGIPGHPGISQGAPVEAAFTPDRQYAYVSNYSMYGSGFGPEGGDNCGPNSGTDDSFLYRVNVAKLAIDQVIQVGPVPKFLAVSPDGRFAVVSNWCGYDVSLVDLHEGQQVQRVPVGAYPRGVVITPDSRTAYIAIMGSTRIAVLDVATRQLSYIDDVGAAPRHLVLDPGGRYLYATLNGAGQVIKIDLASRSVVARVSTGSAPRSMAISTDGQSLYVVNYGSSTMSKVRTSDMVVTQDVATGYHPIGVTYDPRSGDVWVANYSGTLMIFKDLAG